MHGRILITCFSFIICLWAALPCVSAEQAASGRRVAAKLINQPVVKAYAVEPKPAPGAPLSVTSADDELELFNSLHELYKPMLARA